MKNRILKFTEQHPKRAAYWITALAILFIAAALVSAGLIHAKTKLDRKTAELEQKLKATEQDLSLAIEKNDYLEGELALEKNKNSDFEEQIENIASTVGDLEKLSKTDQELLQKYSRVYFLNEHYSPDDVKEIPENFLYRTEKAEYFHSKAWPFLEELFEDAMDDGVDLKVISGYRSFNTQASVKSGYTVTYGSGANQFSADQGYSEHQLGTALDLTDKTVGATFTGFEKTTAYEWLVKNAHKHGFILSYPKNNSYYQFEPWHWRFVGVKLARNLHREGKFFYDLDQREIDKYLIDIFD